MTAERQGTSGEPEQLALVRAAARPGRARALPGDAEPAATDPVAVVRVDVGLAHLDRPFEYLVPAPLDDRALAGVRVKVRFAGQEVDGFLIERRATAEHNGRLAPLRRVVSAEPVLTPTILELCRRVAAHYAGTVSDVLRLAIPPRHATAERALSRRPDREEGADGPPGAPTSGQEAAVPTVWHRYPAGPALLRRLSMGESPAAALTAAPSTTPELDWPSALATAARATLGSGRGALIVVPDGRDVERVDAALRAALGAGRHVRLTADQGPQARYTAWLKVLRGHVGCVVGTRAAMFAPVHDLGLVAWWDDGDDLLSEPRAPYPHVREVLSLRAEVEHTALLVGGFTRTTAVQQWVEHGHVRPVVAGAAEVRASVPRVLVAGEGQEPERDPGAVSAHLPSVAWRSAHRALQDGPVLIQVPRRGYQPSLACQDCRHRARCPSCHGPLAVTGRDGPPTCRWCGAEVRDFTCDCGGRRLRSVVVGARRTAEELGRAFPGVPVHTSGGEEVLASVTAAASLVIATPGAEPVAESGYAATLLLDGWALLDRASLDAGEEALRRWLAAAALTRPARDGGVVVVCGVPPHATLPPVEALVRWDPAWFAARELAERAELSLPPAVRMARVTGEGTALRAALDRAELPAEVEQLGPLPVAQPARQAQTPAAEQVLLRAPVADSLRLARSMRDLRAVRSAHKESSPITVRLDPTGEIA